MGALSGWMRTGPPDPAVSRLLECDRTTGSAGERREPKDALEWDGSGSRSLVPCRYFYIQPCFFVDLLLGALPDSVRWSLGGSARLLRYRLPRRLPYPWQFSASKKVKNRSHGDPKALWGLRGWRGKEGGSEEGGRGRVFSLRGSGSDIWLQGSVFCGSFSCNFLLGHTGSVGGSGLSLDATFGSEFHALRGVVVPTAGWLRVYEYLGMEF
jgi:hypothetical protein